MSAQRIELLSGSSCHWLDLLRTHFHFSCSDRKELGNPEGMLMCPSIEELKNVWLPFSIRMKMTKNKGLDVCNWTDVDEMQVVGKLGRRGVIRERKMDRGKVELSIEKRKGIKLSTSCGLFRSDSVYCWARMEITHPGPPSHTPKSLSSVPIPLPSPSLNLAGD